MSSAAGTKCYNSRPKPNACEQGLECLAKIKDWSTNLHADLSEKKKKCTEWTGKWTEAKASCDRDQNAFEASFCSYREHLRNSCQEYDTCRSKGEASRMQRHKDVAQTEVGRKLAWKAAKKIDCFIHVLNDTVSDERKKKHE